MHSNFISITYSTSTCTMICNINQIRMYQCTTRMKTAYNIKHILKNDNILYKVHISSSLIKKLQSAQTYQTSYNFYIVNQWSRAFSWDIMVKTPSALIKDCHGDPSNKNCSASLTWELTFMYHKLTKCIINSADLDPRFMLAYESTKVTITIIMSAFI